MRFLSRLVFAILVMLVFYCESHSQSLKDSVTVNEYNRLAETFLQSAPDSLYYHAKRGRDLAIKISHKEGLSISLRLIGIYHWTKGDNEEALNHYQESLSIGRLLSNNRIIAASLHNIALVYSRLGDYNKAIDLYYQALILSRELNDIKAIGKIHNNMAVSYRKLKNLKEAKRNLLLAISCNKLIDNKVDLAGCYVNVANIYQLNKELDSALYYNKLSLDVFRELNVSRGVVICLNSQSSIYQDLKKYDSAMISIVEALEISKNGGFIQNELSAKVILADLYFDMGLYREAMELYYEVQDAYLAKGNNGDLLSVYLSIAETLNKLGESKKAVEFFQKHNTLRDSIYSEDLENSLANVRIAYELQQKDVQSQMQNRDHRIAILKRDFTIRIFLVSLILLLLMIYLLFTPQQRRKERLKKTLELQQKEHELIQIKLQNQQLKEIDLRNELEHRNRELSSYTLNIIQKNELLKTIKDELKKLKSEDSVLFKRKAQQIISHAAYSFHQDKEWDSFKQYFVGVHTGFLDKLADASPLIGPNDRRLAALMRLDLSTEQIGSIMGISSSSVKVARHRLRKKLGIKPSISIHSFLERIDEESRPGFSDAENAILMNFKKGLYQQLTIDKSLWYVAKYCIMDLEFIDCVVYLLDESGMSLVQKAAYGPKNPTGIEILAPLEILIDQGICGKVARTCEPILVEDTRANVDYIVDDELRLSELAVPIMVHDKVFGIIDSEHPKAHFFTQDHLNILMNISKYLGFHIEKILKFK